MYDESYLKMIRNWWADEYYNNGNFFNGVHPAFIEENKKTVKEEDEDE